jgi:hypothetical protein
MQDNIEQTDNNQTFFRWVYPFDTPERDIKINSCYLFSVGNIQRYQDTDELAKFLYNSNDVIDDLPDKVYESMWENYLTVNRVSDVPLSHPIRYEVSWNYVEWTLPSYHLYKHFLTVIKLAKFHGENDCDVVVYYCDENLLKVAMYEDKIMVVFESDEVRRRELQKKSINTITHSKTFVDRHSFEKDTHYRVYPRYTGYTMDIYQRPTNENLEISLINHIYDCVDNKKDHKLKEFLNFHYSQYVGKPLDFLEYLEEFCTRAFHLEISSNIKYYEKIVKWTNSKREKLNQLTNKDNGNPTTSATEEKKNLVLSQREIALIYWYDRDILSIDLKTSQKIAEDNGHKSKNSGRGIYNDHYTKVRDKPEERTDNATSEEYLNNIIPRLTTERGKREANEDLKTAKNIKEKKKKGLFY